MEEVLQLYKDLGDEELNYLKGALLYLKNVNINEYKAICETLISIKLSHPEFIFYLDDIGGKAKFIQTGEMFLDKNISSYSVFFHELGHAMHYFGNGYTIPNEFNSRITSLESDSKTSERCLSIIQALKKRKKELEKELGKIILEKQDLENITQISEFIEIQLITNLEDIIDAFYKGESHSRGIRYEKDMFTNVEKGPKSEGHGIDYYSNNANVFLEMIANITSLKCSGLYERYIPYLEYCFGEEFVEFLENYYKIIILDNLPKKTNIENINKLAI